VVDEDGEWAIAVSRSFKRNPAPDSLSWVVAPADTTPGAGYQLKIRWHLVADSTDRDTLPNQTKPSSCLVSIKPDSGVVDSRTVYLTPDVTGSSETALSTPLTTPDFYGCISVRQKFGDDTSLPTTVCHHADPPHP